MIPAMRTIASHSPNSADRGLIESAMDIPANIKKLRKQIEREALYAEITYLQ